MRAEKHRLCLRRDSQANPKARGRERGGLEQTRELDDTESLAPRAEGNIMHSQHLAFCCQIDTSGCISSTILRISQLKEYALCFQGLF